jgi:hypothetical protein
VLSLTSGLAAANVSNRVVAVLDNDTAGRQAERELLRRSLPRHFTVARLPDVPHATAYPTSGPDGLSTSDVNGRAVSVELMFGLDVLRRVTGQEPPRVRWGTYLQSMDAYQGVVTMKREIQAELRRVLTTAARLEDLESQIAGGCQRLTATLVDAVAEGTPMMATDYSPLLHVRARGCQGDETGEVQNR